MWNKILSYLKKLLKVSEAIKKGKDLFVSFVLYTNAIFVFIQSFISFGWKVASDTKALIEFAVCSSKAYIQTGGDARVT